MAYVSQAYKKSIAKDIKNLCDKYSVKATLSVSHNSKLNLNISKGKLDFIGDYILKLKDRMKFQDDLDSENTKQRIKDLLKYGCFDVFYHRIDHYFYNRDIIDFLNAAVKIIKGTVWYDRSDIQTDYFDTAFHISLNIGKYDKPYILI